VPTRKPNKRNTQAHYYKVCEWGDTFVNVYYAVPPRSTTTQRYASGVITFRDWAELQNYSIRVLFLALGFVPWCIAFLLPQPLRGYKHAI
jgi:hypothetical protein